MQVETLIYVYLAICLSMIAFNCVCIRVFSRRDKRTEEVSWDFKERVWKEIDRLSEGEKPDKRHSGYLKSKLRRTGNLLAFDAALEEIYKEDTHKVIEYLASVYPVFVYLSDKYARKDEIRVTFFLHILRKYHVVTRRPNAQIESMIFKLLNTNSIYSRQAAFEVIVSMGNASHVMRAVKTIDRLGVYHNAKLITDSLLKFTGSPRKLAKEIFKDLRSFSVYMQVALINYLRFRSGDYGEEMLKLLLDSTLDDEVRFSCIRYFGKYPYAPAYDVLMSLADEKAVSRWEYAAIVSAALSAYPSDATLARLKRNLSSKEWYIRYNAAASLYALDVTDADVQDVFSGKDRYAQEMLRYRMEKKNAQEEVAE